MTKISFILAASLAIVSSPAFALGPPVGPLVEVQKNLETLKRLVAEVESGEKSLSAEPCDKAVQEPNQ